MRHSLPCAFGDWQQVVCGSRCRAGLNALSLPFVVGPHGRIGLLKPDALAAKP